MKKIIIIIGVIALLLILAYQSTIISRNGFIEDEETENLGYESMSPYEHQVKPIRLKTIEHIDSYSGDYPFRDAKIEGHDEAILRKRNTRYQRYESDLDEPETLIPRTLVSPNAPAPYPLEKRYSQ